MTVLQLGSAAGERGFAQFRDTATGAAEIKLSGAADDFRMRSATLLLGSAVLVDLTNTPVIFEHSAALVARGTRTP